MIGIEEKRLLRDEAGDLLADGSALMNALEILKKRTVDELMTKAMTNDQKLEACANLRAYGWIPAALQALITDYERSAAKQSVRNG
jgi:hypothetical protein